MPKYTKAAAQKKLICISVYLNQETLQIVDRWAHDMDLTRSQVIRHLIREKEEAIQK